MVPQDPGLTLRNDLHGPHQGRLGQAPIGDQDQVDRTGLLADDRVTERRLPCPDRIRHADRGETFNPQSIRFFVPDYQLRHRDSGHETDTRLMDTQAGPYLTKRPGRVPVGGGRVSGLSAKIGANLMI
jgi:hypothetical protein